MVNKKKQLGKKHKKTSSKTFLYVSISFVTVIFLALLSVINTSHDLKGFRASQVLGENKQAETENESDEKNEYENEEDEDEDEEESETENEDAEESLWETEVKSLSGNKIKTKTENDGTVKIEIENETEDLEEDIEDPENIEDSEDEVKISTNSDNKQVITQDRTAAVSDFPLTVNSFNNEISVSTPDGKKQLLILPQQAIDRILASGVLTELEKSGSKLKIESQPNELSGIIELQTKNNEMVYKIKGTKKRKILGFFPVSTPTTAFVSAETGEPLSKEQSIITSVIEFISK